MDKVTIHCDGAAIPNPGVGGWGAVLRYGSAKKEISVLGACYEYQSHV
jgi:ribonuclease HI